MDIGDSFQRTTDKLFDFLPNLLGFLVILLIGWVVAKVAAGLVRKGLEKLGVDRRLEESGSSRYIDAVLPGARPSAGVGTLVFWLVFLVFAFTAVGALKIPVITEFMNRVLAYLPNVIVAILIFVVAALLSSAVAAAIGKFMGDTPTGKIVAGVVPALVMVIAMFMILEQLQIAPEIVRIAFAAVMFALALGLALAFGLGGRDVASRVLEDAYSKRGEMRRQVRQDVSTGTDRASDHFGDHSTGASHTTGGGLYGDPAPTQTYDATSRVSGFDDPGAPRP